MPRFSGGHPVASVVIGREHTVTHWKVRQHHGRIDVAPAPGKDAAFRVALPRHQH